MKSLTIAFLLTLALVRLQAADPIPADSFPLDSRQPEDWRLVILLARRQFQSHQLADAAATAKRALQIAKRYGSSSDPLAVTYYQIANIDRDRGHCSESRANYLHAIAAWEKQPDPKRQYLFNAMVSLLGTLCECDEFDAAEKMFRTFDSKLQRYQSGAMDESQLLVIRATILRARKNYGQAESYYRQAIQLLERTPGSTLLQIEEVRTNLAMVIGKQGRHAEALAESEHVIEFLDHNTFSRPTTLVASLNNAACSLADLGRKDEAERMFARALATTVETYGEDNRFAAKIMLNYARVLHENKQSPASEAMHKRGAEAFRRTLVRDAATVDVEDLRLLH